MTITKTVALSDKDRETVQNFLQLADTIAIATGCSMDDVFQYFADKIEIMDDNTWKIGELHQLSDIG